jgi:hypothetical protein
MERPQYVRSVCTAVVVLALEEVVPLLDRNQETKRSEEALVNFGLETLNNMIGHWSFRQT